MHSDQDCSLSSVCSHFHKRYEFTKFVTGYIAGCQMSNVSVSKGSQAPNAEEYY